MHKEYVVVGEDAYVTNEFGEMKKYSVGSIENLEADNIIEYLDRLIKNFENEIEYNNKEFKNKRNYSIIAIALITVFTLFLEIFADTFISLFIPLSMIGSGLIILNIANYIILKNNNNVLNSKLKYSKEQRRKIVVKQQKITNKNNIEKDIIKKINISDNINILKRELDLIEQYKNNKMQYLTCYKNGCLGIYMSYLGYHSESIAFVASLIEEELNIKQKQKLLTNK